jgi:hypothetical protein
VETGACNLRAVDVVEISPRQAATEFVVHGTTDETISGCDRAHVWFCDLDDVPKVEPAGRSCFRRVNAPAPNG